MSRCAAAYVALQARVAKIEDCALRGGLFNATNSMCINVTVAGASISKRRDVRTPERFPLLVCDEHAGAIHHVGSPSALAGSSANPIAANKTTARCEALADNGRLRFDEGNGNLVICRAHENFPPQWVETRFFGRLDYDLVRKGYCSCAL